MNIDYYDDVMAILMDVNLLKRLVDAGIPKDELFIPLADYLSINCIAAGQKENVEEENLTIIGFIQLEKRKSNISSSLPYKVSSVRRP